MHLARPWAPALLRSMPACLLVLVLAAPVFGSEDILGGKLEKKNGRSEAQIKADISRLEKQSAANPASYRVYFDLGNVYMEANDLDKAKVAYEKAIELNPKYVEAMVNLGGLYSDLENHDEAITWFEKALALKPEDCKARSNLGNVYYAMQRYPDAMFEYRRAMKQDPSCTSAMFNMAVAFADAGLFREAVVWWKKVEKIAPNTEPARMARENINILERFTPPPEKSKTAPAGGGSKGSPKP